MTLKIILLWIGLASAAWVAISARPRPRRRTQWGWIVVGSGIVLLSGVAYLIVPAVAGYVAAGLALVLIALPALGARLMAREVAQQRYDSAQRVADLIRWLHPADDWWRWPALYHALALHQRGQATEALAVFERHASDDTPAGRMARMYMFQIEGRWAELRDWYERLAATNRIESDPVNQLYYLRSLGETGALLTLIDTYARLRPQLRGTYLDMARLYLFAFAGQRGFLDDLFAGPLRAYPAAVRAFWLGSADQAAGDGESARQRLASLLSDPHQATRSAVERRLAQPLPYAGATLTAEAKAILARAAQEAEQQALAEAIRPKL